MGARLPLQAMLWESDCAQVPSLPGCFRVRSDANVNLHSLRLPLRGIPKARHGKDLRGYIAFKVLVVVKAFHHHGLEAIHLEN